MQENMIAIDAKAFDELIMSFYKVKEELNATLGSIDSLVDVLESENESDSSAVLIANYRSFMKVNKPVVLDNMETFISDLKAARANVDAFDRSLSMRIYENK